MYVASRRDADASKARNLALQRAQTAEHKQLIFPYSAHRQRSCNYNCQPYLPEAAGLKGLYVNFLLKI